MRILGIDPGTITLGYAIIEANQQPLLLTSGIVKLNDCEQYQKLSIVLQQISNIVVQYNPQVMSIETPFYGKNIQTMFKLGRIQGIAIAVAINNGMDVYEFTPREIKQSITGNGNSSKEQVQKMLSHIINDIKIIEAYDESDAVAIALTYYFRRNTPKTNSSYSNWNDFIRKNNNRII